MKAGSGISDHWDVPPFLRRHWRWKVALAVIAACALVAPALGASQAGPQKAWQVQARYTSEFGVARPAGVTYDARDGRLLVADRSGRLIELTDAEDLTESGVLPAGDQLAMAFDSYGHRLTTVAGDQLQLDGADTLPKRPQDMRPVPGHLDAGRVTGSTFDPATGVHYLLDGGRRRVLVLDPRRGNGAARVLPLNQLPATELKGLAFDPSDGLLYVASYPAEMLYALDSQGKLVATYSLAGVDLIDPQAMTFAATPDNTDDPALTSLFIADAGGPGANGQVAELSLEPQVVTAPAFSATLVKTTDMSQQVPPSPDPSGIAFIKHKGELLVADSEVDEMPWLFSVYGVNLYPLSLGGASLPQAGVTVTPGTTHQEPTGIAYNPSNQHLFWSDDDQREVYELRAGVDGQYGTTDDPPVTHFDTQYLRGTRTSANTDPEDVTFDPDNGHLYTIDGTGREVYDYGPGTDGVFATSDDPVATHFDVQVHGAIDPEGISYYAAHQSLLVLDHTSYKIYEVSLGGALLQVIDISTVSAINPAGLAQAPASDGSGAWHAYMVDRGIDNDPQPLENDGKLYELALGLDPPTFSITPTAGANGSISPTTPQTVVYGGSQSFAITPDAGFQILDVLVDGLSVGPVTTYDFTNVTANRTIAASFFDPNVQTFTITPTAGPNGSISPATPQTVVSGGSKSFTITPDAGFQVLDVLVDGLSVGPVTTYDFTNVTANRTIGASFAAPPTANAGPDQILTPAALPTQTTLNGSGSTDDVGIQSYLWSQLSGPTTAAVSDAGAVKPTVSGLQAGTYEFQLKVTDTSGLTHTDSVLVTVQFGAVAQVWDGLVNAGSDDAEEFNTGAVDLTSSDLELIYDARLQKVGLRFNNVTVPYGATITGAWIQFRTDEVSQSAVTLTLRGQASSNAATFTTAINNISSRPLTTASVAWSPPSWLILNEVGPNQKTPDLKSIVQEIVTTSGWTGGNSLAVIVLGTQTTKRTADSREGGYGPRLHIEYTTGGPPPDLPPTANAGPDQTLTPTALPTQATLDGSGSTDDVGIQSYLWSQLSGPTTATFSDTGAVKPTVSGLQAGAYGFQLRVTDTAGLTHTDAVLVTVQFGAVAHVWDGLVSAGSDDAEEYATGTVDLISSDLELIYDNRLQKVGLRFNNVTVPYGATITGAWIQFRTDEVSKGAITVTLRGQASSNAATFTTAINNISSRPLTTASVPWSPPDWLILNEVGANQKTPDLKSIVQEIVTTSGWTGGNSLAIIVLGTQTTRRTADSREGGFGPQLHIEYTVP